MRHRAGVMKGKNGKIFSNKEMIQGECMQQTTQQTNSNELTQLKQAQDRREEIRRQHTEQERIRKEQAEQEQLIREQRRMEKEAQERLQFEKQRKEMETNALVTPTDLQLVSAGVKLTFRATNDTKIMPLKKHITYEDMLLFMRKLPPNIVESYCLDKHCLDKQFEKFLTDQTAFISTAVPLIYAHLIAISLGGFPYCEFLARPRYDCVGVYYARKFANKMVTAEAYSEVFPAILPHFVSNCCAVGEFTPERYNNWLLQISQARDLKDIAQLEQAAPVTSALTAFFCKFPPITVLAKKLIKEFTFVNNSVVSGLKLAHNKTISLLEQKMQITHPVVCKTDGFEVTLHAAEFATDYCKCYCVNFDLNSRNLKQTDSKYLFIMPHGGICIESIIRSDGSIENIIKRAISTKTEANESFNFNNFYKFTFPRFVYQNTTNPAPYTVAWLGQLAQNFPEDAKKYCRSIAGHISNTAASYTHVNFDLDGLFLVTAVRDVVEDIVKDVGENEAEKTTECKTKNTNEVKDSIIFNRPFLLIQLAKNNQLVSMMKIGSATAPINDTSVDKNEETNNLIELNNSGATNTTEKTPIDKSVIEQINNCEPSYIVDDL